MLMSFRKAEIAFSAADSSLKVSSVPMTIRRCFLVCPESLQTMEFRASHQRLGAVQTAKNLD
jgi:hypothetical protein